MPAPDTTSDGAVGAPPGPPDRAATATATGLPRWAGVALAAGWVVAATALQVLRQAGQTMWDTIWAEDGTLFLVQAEARPLHEVLLAPYAGYANAVPRALAAVAVELPPAWWAPWFTFSSALIVSLLSLFTYLASGPLRRSPLRQGVLAGAVVLLPVLPWEVVGAICNIQWSVALPCLLALLFPVRRVGAIVVRSVLAVLGPLTAPLAALLAPVALWQVVAGLRRRQPLRTLVVPGLYLLASGVQVLVYLGADQLPADRPPPGELAADLARLYGNKVATDLVFGVRTTDWLWPSLQWWLPVLAVVVLAALLAWKLWRGSAACRWWVGGLTGASVVLFALQLIPRTSSIPGMLPTTERWSFVGMRWEILPALLLVLALLVPLDTRPGLTAGYGGDDARRPAGVTGGLPWRAVAAVVALWAAVALVPSYRFTNHRSSSVAWSWEVVEGTEACRADPAEDEVPLTISPEWELDVACERLR